MAFTVTRVAGTARKEGNRRRAEFDITFDSSYATGGESLTASEFGFRKLDCVIPHGAFRKSDATDAVMVSYDYTNNKLAAYRQKDPAAAGGADIALPEVGSTVNLSSYSGRVTVLGY